MGDKIGQQYKNYGDISKDLIGKEKKEITPHIGSLGGRRFTLGKVEFSIKELIHLVADMAKNPEAKATKQDLIDVKAALVKLDQAGKEKLDAKDTGTLARILTKIKSLFGNIYHGKNSGYRRLDALISGLSETSETPKNVDDKKGSAKNVEPKNVEPKKDESKNGETPKTSDIVSDGEVAYPNARNELTQTYGKPPLDRALERYKMDSKADIPFVMLAPLKCSIVAHLSVNEVVAPGEYSSQYVAEIIIKVRKECFALGKPTSDNKTVQEQIDRDFKLLEELVKIDNLSAPKVSTDPLSKLAYTEVVLRDISELPFENVGKEGVLVPLNVGGELQCKAMYPLISDKTNGIEAVVLLTVDPNGKDKNTAQIVFKASDPKAIGTHDFEKVKDVMMKNAITIIGDRAIIEFKVYGLGIGGADAQKMCMIIAENAGENSKIELVTLNPQPISLSEDQAFSALCKDKNLEFNTLMMKTKGDLNPILLEKIMVPTFLGFTDVSADTFSKISSKTTATVLTSEQELKTEHRVIGEGKLVGLTVNQDYKNELKIGGQEKADLMQATALAIGVWNDYNAKKYENKQAQFFNDVVAFLEKAQPELAERLRLASQMTSAKEMYDAFYSPETQAKVIGIIKPIAVEKGTQLATDAYNALTNFATSLWTGKKSEESDYK